MTEEQKPLLPPSAEELLKKLVDLHEIEARIVRGGENYDAIRQHTRESKGAWEAARAHIYGPREVDNQPRNKLEADRWNKNARKVAASRPKPGEAA